MSDQPALDVLPIVTVVDAMPEDGYAVVVGDESGTGSLWLDWAFHGPICVTSDDLANGTVILR